MLVYIIGDNACALTGTSFYKVLENDIFGHYRADVDNGFYHSFVKKRDIIVKLLYSFPISVQCRSTFRQLVARSDLTYHKKSDDLVYM